MTIYQIIFHFLWTFCTQIDNQALLDQIVTDCILAEHTFSLCAAFGHSYRDLCILDKPLIFIALRVEFLWDRAQPQVTFTTTLETWDWMRRRLPSRKTNWWEHSYSAEHCGQTQSLFLTFYTTTRPQTYYVLFLIIKTDNFKTKKLTVEDKKGIPFWCSSLSQSHQGVSGNSGNALKNTFFPPENVPELTTMTEAGEMTSSGGGGNHREGNCLKTG